MSESKEKAIAIPKRIQMNLQAIQGDINALLNRRNDILQTFAMAMGIDGEFNIQPDFSALLLSDSPVQLAEDKTEKAG